MSRDELDDRVRSLNAERTRPTPDAPPRKRTTVPELSAATAWQLRQLIVALEGLYMTPPDVKQ